MPASATRRLGRFELLRELGRGAQATVWLAHDPRLEREVALKLLNPGADADAVSQWLDEARAVSRLNHPNIVPVFEADEHEGQPYLVFEYVEGPTLSEARRSRPAMPAKEAVALLLGVLDALSVAHDHGIVHRDLKPSNILLGRDGRARVMDFGIAARTDRTDGRIVGSPGYISPEAARGQAPLPAMDVFSAGVLLGELLAGTPLMQEHDPYRAVQRVQTEDMVLPAHAKVDQVLRGIVQRALARDAAARYDSARSMHRALSAWLNPEQGALPDAGNNDATLQFLLRRMRHKTDFPALSASVLRIQRIASSDRESLRTLTDEILRDVALTNKLLRMVNTVHFTAAAGGGVSTVSRAVALVGFAGIRNMALSVLLLEHMSDKAHVAVLKEEFLRALMAGMLADTLSPIQREGEEAFLGAMFQNLGRLLTEYYFPEEAVQIRTHLGDHTPGHFEREAAARRVLGLGFEDLGSGVAKAWGLPDSLQQALRAPQGEIPSRPLGRGPDQAVERLRWLGRGANAVADVLLAHDGEEQGKQLALVADQYAPLFGVNAREIVGAAHTSRQELSQLAQAMGLNVARHAPARRLIAETSAGLDLSMAKTLILPSGQSGGAQHRLNHALDEVRGAIAGQRLSLNEVLKLVLDGMLHALDLHRVVFCMREPRGGRLLGRVGVGADAMELSAAFRIEPEAAGEGDLFAALCTRGADLLISDAAAVAGKLPLWYRERVNAPTFLLMPLMIRRVPIGLIYADKLHAGSLVLGDAELTLLRSLRDQVAAAFARATA
ncbi:Serine/threonine protein kinase [Rubrivivax sp. A210]|uniref:protein kinase domain-containing protein n=1 Tax=Rubrivivax sp. A210 TaxID=2772301 RepID=UPI001917AEDA|nr:serine/threonine protein kinase [Rubrivivax sp. A210]CAD5373960.1 Serine/threonine protein kinase [Rubrivivax sp. A210]